MKFGRQPSRTGRLEKPPDRHKKSSPAKRSFLQKQPHPRMGGAIAIPGYFGSQYQSTSRFILRFSSSGFLKSWPKGADSNEP
jgi:hypothetical protein